MMNQITFDGYRSFDDLYLILSEKEIGSPDVKKYAIAVEGGDGELDYTEYFGEPKFSNRTLTFVFSTIKQPFLEQYSRLQSLLQGRKVKIVLDEDADFYYIGRLSISAFTNEKNIGKISIECDCEPYKLKQTETVVTKTISGTETITLSNLRKRVAPTITASAEMTYSFNGMTATQSAGTFIFPEFELVAGDNTITVAGNGTVSFKYQEGGL